MVWKKDIRVLDVEEPPPPGAGQVKVKVQWCGICGSDLHEYLAGPIFVPVNEAHPITGLKAPVILGHEFSGEVVEIGPGVTNVKVGDRVVSNCMVVCGKCYYCMRYQHTFCEKLAIVGLMAHGGFAEYVNVPDFGLYKLPDNVSSEAGALVEPLAVGSHGVRQAPVIQGDTVVILGAGPIGLATLQSARSAGASKIFIIEIAEKRKEYARQLGATAVFDPRFEDVFKRVWEATGGFGADVAFECIGNEKTAPMAVNLTRKGGKTVIVGLFEKESSVNFNNIMLAERHVIGVFGHRGEFSVVIDLLADGRIKAEPMITRKISLDDIVEKGFKELVNRKEENIKILVTPSRMF